MFFLAVAVFIGSWVIGIAIEGAGNRIAKAIEEGR